MTYEELRQLAPGTLVRVKGASPFDHMIRVEMTRDLIR